MTRAQAKQAGYCIERYPATAEETRTGRRYLWRLLGPGGRTLNAGYASRRKLLAWLEQEIEDRGWEEEGLCALCRNADSEYRVFDRRPVTAGMVIRVCGDCFDDREDMIAGSRED